MIYINGTPVNTTLFPDNTSQVWKVPTFDIPETNFVHIRWEFSHEGEFMQLAQLKDLADKYGFSTCLRILYLPYGRQDKEVSNNSTFALRTFANLLNTLTFDEVIIHDPHSFLALELIDNARAVYPTKEVAAVYEETRSDVICYPDKGALSKYEAGKIYDYPSVGANKVRDQETGEILGMSVVDSEVEHRTVLIVDDICDGGATFIQLTKLLLNCGAKEVNLFVSHGIFSKGLRVLKDAGIKRIFTPQGEVSEHQNNLTYRTL